MEKSEGRDFSDGQSVIVHEALPLVSCFWCERLHPGEHPLSVCPACAARYSIMRSLEMSGSYPLNDDAIDEMLPRTSPGNYALGYMDDMTFVVFYVGRSDSDLRHLSVLNIGPPRNCWASSLLDLARLAIHGKASPGRESVCV
jgi:hypothetical protein